MEATASTTLALGQPPLVVAAHCEARQGHTARAIELLRRHLNLDTEDLSAWVYQGNLLHRQGSLHAALVCYQRALRISVETAPLWSSLGRLWSDLDQHEQAIRCHRRALVLAPDNPSAHLACVRSLCEAQRFDAALDAVDRCLRVGQAQQDVQELRAQILFYLGRHAEGWQQLARSATVADSGTRQLGALDLRASLVDRRVLVYAEHGHGMTILAGRFLYTLLNRGADVTLVCEPVLHPLFLTLPIRCVTPEQDLGDQHFDFQTTLLRLPALIDPGGRVIPQALDIAVEDERRHRFRGLCGGVELLKVAVVWSPSPLGRDHQRRSFEFERLHRLAHLDGVRLVSLQKGLPLHQLLASGWRNQVTDLGLLLGDFGDTAAALAAVDLVLCCDCAVAHLAASMNLPVLLLLNTRPDWLFGLHGDATPWYPSMRILRQPDAGDWDGVLLSAIEFILRLASARRRC